LKIEVKYPSNCFFLDILIIFECHNFNKIDLLQLIVAPHLSGGWQHNYSTKTRQAGRANEQPIYSLMSMLMTQTILTFRVAFSCMDVTTLR
jgi:hypothetical protein